MLTRFLQVLWLATVVASLGLFIGGLASGGDLILVLMFSAIALAAGLAIVYIATGSAGLPRQKKSAQPAAPAR